MAGGDGAYSTLPADLPAVNMGGAPLVDVPLEVDDNLWRVTCINVGNPHCVTVVPDVDALRLEEIGPAFEHHANFPERINTEFVQVVDATHLKMRVWERGSGETWACGTGTCATVAAMTELGICPAGEDVHVQLRGGELTIRVLPGNELRMTGAAETVCQALPKCKRNVLASPVRGFARCPPLPKGRGLGKTADFAALPKAPPLGELTPVGG